MTKVAGVSSRVINVDVVKGQTNRLTDGDTLNWGVEEVQASDARRSSQLMGGKELRLNLAFTVGSVAVPVLCSTTVDRVTRCSSNGNILSRDGNERSSPLRVSETIVSVRIVLHMVVEEDSRCVSLEDDFSTGSKASQVKGGTSWNSNAVENNGGAAGLLGLSSGSTGECATSASIQSLRELTVNTRLNECLMVVGILTEPGAAATRAELPKRVTRVDN